MNRKLQKLYKDVNKATELIESALELLNSIIEQVNELDLNSENEPPVRTKR